MDLHCHRPIRMGRITACTVTQAARAGYWIVLCSLWLAFAP